MTVILGKNRFVNCQAIFGFEGRAVLSVSPVPLAVDLSLPPTLPKVDEPSLLKTVRSDQSFAIFKGDEDAIVVATRISSDLIHLKIDLRAVGMNIYDDVAGLHIGTSTFAGNELIGAAIAINLS
ncbi:MAG: hypothetical protein ABJA82_13575 [Myxococcales bacterium]